MSLLSLLPFLIIFSGTYFLIKTNFFFILHPKRTLKFAFSADNKKESIFSLILALAGTLGVGNIVGVAIGLSIGGNGSVFWLLVSALFSSVIKYSEVYLSTLFGKGKGMIDVTEKSFGTFGKALSYSYAAIALILALFMGCIFQAEAIHSSVSSIHTLPHNIILSVITAFTALICLPGKKRIKNAVAIIVPIASLVYTAMCLFVIINEISAFPKMILSILKSAFDFKSFSGGLVGFLSASGMKEGFARGLLSNEAGAGTSSFSHTSHANFTTQESGADSEYALNNARAAGIFGIAEVLFDTLLLCPLTAFAVLLGGYNPTDPLNLSGIIAIFSNYIGNSAPYLLLFSILAFAISTVLCWYYYGKISAEYIFGKNFYLPYNVIFFLLFALSISGMKFHTVFAIDTSLFFISIISIATLFKNRNYIR